MKVYQAIAVALNARNNCQQSGNTEWENKWQERLDYIAHNALPSGSGVDSGTTIDTDSRKNEIVLNTAFHHMNDAGIYDGWTEHEIVISASLLHNFTIKIFGKNRNDIKTYLGELFEECLSAEYVWHDAPAIIGGAN